MRKNNKKEKILRIIGENLNYCDTIIMNIFKDYTIRIYRLGVNDAFYWENQKLTWEKFKK